MNLKRCYVKALRHTVVALALSVSLCPVGSSAQTNYQPSRSNLEARRWFQDAKFGMFIHWGVYSVPGGEYKGQTAPRIAEWIMNDLKIPISEYEQFAREFNPIEFDPAEWVRAAKNAGMRYITITSKHHDGFAMWDSQVSTWDIMDSTPYKRDILKMLADECQKQNIKLFFYHSHLDWHHPDYYPRGRTGHDAGRPEGGDFNRYLDYMDAQLAELLSGRYGWWEQQDKTPGAPPTKTKVDWRLEKTYGMVHRLQPQALIGNNHHVAPFPGEDFQMFEKDLPGQNTAGFNADAKIGSLPLEACDTTNDSWGYKKSDKNFKTPKQLIHFLVNSAGRDANFLLNVGPMPTGKMQPEVIEQFTQLGGWMSKNSETIYGTRGGPVAPQKWGVTTRKGNEVYVHVLDAAAAEGEEIALPGLRSKVRSAKLFKGGGEVRFDESKNVLYLPRSARDAIDTIVVLEVARQ